MARDGIQTAKLRGELMAQIAQTNDQSMKIILLFMLNMLDEIVDRIDEILDDERGLRETVLNGHEPVHHAHHEWVAARIKQEEDDAKAAADEKKEERKGWRAVRFSVIERVITTAALVVMGLYGWAGH